ncbi:MAG TPA: class I tRNA ligase family protein, partial [Methylomirabilota bacterium]|nr:class I tRNA ligase family protein [Methylomirabilota bacterium]
MERYDIPNAVKPILPFIDDASNWYVRRSRKRFWKSGDDADKQAAYQTLHYVLTQLSLIMAPFTPFLAEELFQKLTGGESVHLLDWPEAGHINEIAIQDMQLVREAITVGLAKRAEAGIKVRQPLSKVVAPAHNFTDSDDRQEVYKDIIAEELNVKEVIFNNTDKSRKDRMNKSTEEAAVIAVKEPIEVQLDLEITPDLKDEGLMREIVRNVQQARKQAGLEVDDRIDLSLDTTDKDLAEVLKNPELTDVIEHETLASSLNKVKESEFTTTAKIDGVELSIGLSKV